MRFGYWLPVFGGWLRNVDDENMEASWAYVKRLAQRSEALGFDLTLIAELNLNDIKGVEAPSLDAWSTAAAAVEPAPPGVRAPPDRRTRPPWPPWPAHPPRRTGLRASWPCPWRPRRRTHDRFRGA